jgi:hypothetical protein
MHEHQQAAPVLIQRSPDCDHVTVSLPAFPAGVTAATLSEAFGMLPDGYQLLHATVRFYNTEDDACDGSEYSDSEHDCPVLYIVLGPPPMDVVMIPDDISSLDGGSDV